MSQTDSHPILEVKDLQISFFQHEEEHVAVDNINFSLNQGETLGIVGESGSGKSVTSMAIMNLLQYNGGVIKQGEILFDSPTLGKVDLCKLSKKDAQQIRGKEIAMIFQEPMTSLNPVYTCGEQVKEAIIAHEKCSNTVATQKTLDLFNQVKLPRPEKILESYPHELSGGQKQRVMIAMALVSSPKLLIADEPTTALDVTVQKEILLLLRELRDENNLSIIFITHDLGVIGEIADEVLVIYKGKQIEKNSIIELFENPQEPYTKGLLACKPSLNRNPARLTTVREYLQGKTAFKETSTPQVQTTFKKVTLEVKNISTFFPLDKNWLGKPLSYVKAVNDVSFKVHEGETIGLVGESGCGKTTLGRTILGLVAATAGEIWYNGENITHKKGNDFRKLRQELQIIFQDPYSSLNPRITTGEAIMEPMEVHGVLKNKAERKEKTLALLEKVGLEKEHFYRFPHEFSGGQRQRIGIARTLALNPKIIICDESVSALDVSVQAQVLNLLNDLKEEFKFTYIFISHDLSVVRYMSDRIFVMQNGSIIEEGTPDEIYLHPKNAYTRTLIDSIPEGSVEKVKEIQAERLSHNHGT